MTRTQQHLILRDQRNLIRARAGFLQIMPAQYDEREAAIRALPTVQWNGRALKTLTCTICGRERNEPEALCWHLISVELFQCQWCGRYGPTKFHTGRPGLRAGAIAGREAGATECEGK